VKVLSENQTWLATGQITFEFQIPAGKYFKRDARIVLPVLRSTKKE